jgi:predicted nucleic acid-binding protein
MQVLTKPCNILKRRGRHGHLRLCLDTSVLIAYLRGREPGFSAVRQAAQESACYVAAMTVYELLFGLARSGRSLGEEKLLGLMNVIPLSDTTARLAAKLHTQLIRENNDIGIKDVLIAATCLEHSLPILTLNERHFMLVPNLIVLTPNTFMSAR